MEKRGTDYKKNKEKGKIQKTGKEMEMTRTRKFIKSNQRIIAYLMQVIPEKIKHLEKLISSCVKHKKGKFALVFFRKNSAVSVVFVATALVTAGNLNFSKGQSGFLFGAKKDLAMGSQEITQQRIKQQGEKSDNLAAVSLDMEEPALTEEEISQLALSNEEMNKNQMQYQVLTATEAPDAKKLLSEGADVSVYEVRQGDTVSTIATDFNITTKTILWANDIDDPDMIQPGDKIFILPTTGVKHVVKSGDTVKKIAKEYEAEEDKIIVFNDLPANGDIKEGEELIIPGGKIEEPEPATPSTLLQQRQYYSSGVAESPDRTPSVIDRNPKGGHSFPYGYCTWYVASKKYVPWGGNAGTWLYNAKAYGVKTGKKPKKGAIIVTSESWYGHVGIVEKVSGNNVTISEMNYKGWGKVNTRTLSAKSRVIKGYIY